MPYLGVLCSNFEKLLSYLLLAPPKSPNDNIKNAKLKMSKFENKNAFFGYALV